MRLVGITCQFLVSLDSLERLHSPHSEHRVRALTEERERENVELIFFNTHAYFLHSVGMHTAVPYLTDRVFSKLLSRLSLAVIAALQTDQSLSVSLAAHILNSKCGRSWRSNL